MELSNSQLLEAEEALSSLNQISMNLDTRQKVRRMLRIVTPHAKDVRDLLGELIQRHGGKKDAFENWTIQPDSEQWPAFIAEYNEFMQKTVSIESIEQVAEEELWKHGSNGKREPIDVPGALMDKLGPLEKKSDS